ncbi:MAG: YajQ family cyclic di-GMP-binding protein [Candidatus Comchoanobacterales bacterium]
MPSFDIVSEVDQHELKNAVQQCEKEIRTRFDLANTSAKVSIDTDITVFAENSFQLEQVTMILNLKLTKRGIDPRALKSHDIQTDHKNVKQRLSVITGIETDLAKKINQQIKQAKLKVQSQIQDKKLRVTGKKRDDLQNVMSLVKEMNADQPLQFNNFKD